MVCNLKSAVTAIMTSKLLRLCRVNHKDTNDMTVICNKSFTRLPRSLNMSFTMTDQNIKSSIFANYILPLLTFRCSQAIVHKRVCFFLINALETARSRKLLTK